MVKRLRHHHMKFIKCKSRVVQTSCLVDNMFFSGWLFQPKKFNDLELNPEDVKVPK